MQFIMLILAAIIAEGIITYVQSLIENGKFKWQMIISLVIGIFVSTVYGINLFVMVGMTSIIPNIVVSQIIGCVLTGILISRGSNYIFDLIKQLGSATNLVNTTSNNMDAQPLISIVNTKPAAAVQSAADIHVTSNTAANPPSEV